MHLISKSFCIHFKVVSELNPLGYSLRYIDKPPAFEPFANTKAPTVAEARVPVRGLKLGYG